MWIDCEMTGLDLERDALIEVAALVTDKDLNVLGEGVDVLIKPREEQLAGMSDFVREMHTKSGLLDARIAHSWPGTCPSWRPMSTTATWTSPP